MGKILFVALTMLAATAATAATAARAETGAQSLHGASHAKNVGSQTPSSLSYRGIGPASSERDLKSLFRRSSCSPVRPLPDFSCKADGSYAGKIPAHFDYAVWASESTWRIYQLEVTIPAAGMQDDVISALRSKYGTDEYKASSSKVVMNVRFVEPATHTWHVGKDVVILTEANVAASQQLSVEYIWAFSASEDAERKAWQASHRGAGASNGASAPLKPALDASSL